MEKEEIIKALKSLNREIFNSNELTEERKEEATRYIYKAVLELR